MTTKQSITIAIGIAIAFTVALIMSSLLLFRQNSSLIQPFDVSGDLEQVLAIAERDRYWLTLTPGYSFEHVFQHGSPNANPANEGILKTSVIRHDNQVAGFTSYYMRHPETKTGQLLFLATREDMRGKGYGEILLRHGLKELERMGAKRIIIFLRISNDRARRLYERVGFREFHRDEEAIKMEYFPESR